MPRRALHRIVARTAVGLACGFLATVVRMAAAGQGCPCDSAADEFRAADVGLVREWIVQLPFDSAGWRLEDVVVGDGLVVARSGDGRVHAVRTTREDSAPARAGTVAWSTSSGGTGRRAWPPTIGTRLVVVTDESTIHAVDRDTGSVEWTRPSDAVPGGAATQSGNWVYAPLQTSRILRLPVNPLGSPESMDPPAAPVGRGRRGDEAAATPPPPESLEPIWIEAGGRPDAAPLPLADGVLWSTDHGLVALERTPRGWLRHALPETDPPSWERRNPVSLAGPPVLREGAIFLATAAGGLARIDLGAENRPGLRSRWFTTLPDKASAGPLVSGTAVVVPLGPTGIAAFAAADGREAWRSDLVGTVIAVAGGRVWVLDTVGRLTALDLATGSRRQSLGVGCFTLPVVNTLTERIVLASPGGLLVSLGSPASAPQPISRGAPAARGSADPAATPR